MFWFGVPLSGGILTDHTVPPRGGTTNSVLLVFQDCPRDRNGGAGSWRLLLELPGHFDCLVVVFFCQLAEYSGDIELSGARTPNRRLVLCQQADLDRTVFPGKALGRISGFDCFIDGLPTPGPVECQ